MLFLFFPKIISQSKRFGLAWAQRDKDVLKALELLGSFSLVLCSYPGAPTTETTGWVWPGHGPMAGSLMIWPLESSSNPLLSRGLIAVVTSLIQNAPQRTFFRDSWNISPFPRRQKFKTKHRSMQTLALLHGASNVDSLLQLPSAGQLVPPWGILK